MSHIEINGTYWSVPQPVFDAFGKMVYDLNECGMAGIRAAKEAARYREALEKIAIGSDEDDQGSYALNYDELRDVARAALASEDPGKSNP